tara:strand:- start:42 stop:644 length:603 start_codon:yes stop_codon:yes gene_type:complete
MQLQTEAFTFNKETPFLGLHFSQPAENDFPELQFKYASLAYVYQNTTSYVQQILDAMPLGNNHKRTVVDIKVTEIKPGLPPCLPGWHCDSVIDPYDETLPEVHHIFVTGGASLTEFIGQPVELNYDSALKHQKLLASFRKQIDKIENLKVWKIPSCQIATYGRFDFHRGSIGLFSEKRLLIRATETDLIKPRNTPYENPF